MEQNPRTPTLGDSEYRFAAIVWENEPVASGQLVKLCAQQLGWKKSTVYTVLKNLIAKGILQNNDSIVTSLVKREQVEQSESIHLVDRAFGGSLPRFVAAFLGGSTITAEEAAQLQTLIDQYKEN